MTEPGHGSDEPRARALLVAGILLLLIGGVGAIFARISADRSLFDPDYTAMWVFVIIAALGAVALIVRSAVNR